MAVYDKGLHSVVAVCVQYPDAGIQQCHVRVYVRDMFGWKDVCCTTCLYVFTNIRTHTYVHMPMSTINHCGM